MALLDRGDSINQKIEQSIELAKQQPMVGMKYTDAYRDAVFAVWYSRGKPTARSLTKMVPNPVDFGLSCGFPSETTVLGWLEDFRERAVVIDEEVTRKMQERLVADKVQMLNTHAQIGTDMQRRALEFFESNPEKMNGMVALRMLVEGVRIERESRGVSRTIEQLVDKTDEELMKQIKELLSYSTVEYQPLTDGLPEGIEDAL